MKEKIENHNLSPEESEKKKKNKIVKVRVGKRSLPKELDIAKEDVIFYSPLKDEKKDETAPLHRGGIDMWFLLWAMLLVCFGTVMSYSASAIYAGEMWRHIIFTLAASVVTVFFVIFARPWFWRIFGVGAYVVSVLLLIAVRFIGEEGGGAQRWIEVRPITIQPSEIAKLAVVMVLALYLTKYEKQVNSTHKFGGNFKHGFLVPMIIIGVLCGLIALQPHLSGLMIVGIIGVAVMYLGGTRLKWLLIFVGIIGIAGIVFISFFGYTMERIEIWLHIDEMDPLGQAWQTLQGLYAIGSGGFFGLGLGSSRQKYGYVSQPQNDFIFTIICEELGFVGAFAMIFLFALLVWRGIKIGQKAPDKFCALTVWGLTFKIGLQALMNIAVVTNSMPNTGISLPFFSAGGTSLMLQIFEIGIILSISRFSTIKK